MKERSRGLYVLSEGEFIDEGVLEELEIWLKENESDLLEWGTSLVEQWKLFVKKKTVEHGKSQNFGWFIYIMLILILCFTVPWKLIIYLVNFFFNYPQFILAPTIITMLDRWFFMR